jgi:hypothetical protein
MYQMQYPHETSSNQTFDIIIYCCSLILEWKLYNWALQAINHTYAWAFSSGIVWKVQLQEMRHNFCFSILILSLEKMYTHLTLCVFSTPPCKPSYFPFTSTLQMKHVAICKWVPSADVSKQETFHIIWLLLPS